MCVVFLRGGMVGMPSNGKSMVATSSNTSAYVRSSRGTKEQTGSGQRQSKQLDSSSRGRWCARRRWGCITPPPAAHRNANHTYLLLRGDLAVVVTVPCSLAQRDPTGASCCIRLRHVWFCSVAMKVCRRQWAGFCCFAKKSRFRASDGRRCLDSSKTALYTDIYTWK